jgi:ribonuclease-3
LPQPSAPHPLEKTLGYRFEETALLHLALTHPSYHTRAHAPNNQRLEFLGDAVLQFTISAWLYEKMPQASEGKLTATRAALVNRKRLETWAQELALPRYLRTGKGLRRHSAGAILADACEALLGAIYLDGGIGSAQSIILRYYEKQFVNIDTLAAQIHNPKGALQERLQQEGAAPPVYKLIHSEGPPHACTYTVEVSCQNIKAQATASSKKEAEIEAARIVMQALNSKLQ